MAWYHYYPHFRGGKWEMVQGWSSILTLSSAPSQTWLLQCRTFVFESKLNSHTRLFPTFALCLFSLLVDYKSNMYLRMTTICSTSWKQSTLNYFILFSHWIHVNEFWLWKPTLQKNSLDYWLLNSASCFLSPSRKGLI